ncbi:MAG: uroporphyrinogen-III synthase [Thermoleophilia bacterium]|nr:uroporphyrinogen-III synthase [Thermoleophilia bacterium]
MARVVVTRPLGQEAELVERLRAEGHTVEHIPLIAIEPTGDTPVDVEGYDLVVITSPNGARELRRRMRGTPARVAAIGRATADAFGGADIVAEISTQEGLLAALPPALGRVLFAVAENARSLLPDALAAEVVTLYRTVELAPPALAADLVVLASPSSARSLGRLPLPRPPVVTIGPETTRAARTAGLEVVAEATTHDVEGLVDAIARATRALQRPA